MWISRVIPTLATGFALLIGPPAPSQQAAEPDKPAVTAPAAVSAVAANDVGADTKAAEKALAALVEQYPSLKGTTVTVGEAPGGKEAVAYYVLGKIVIDRDHSVDIEKILAHEVWHVIDYRDNGRLDWGEDLPPANAADYLTR